LLGHALECLISILHFVAWKKCGIFFLQSHERIQNVGNSSKTSNHLKESKIALNPALLESHINYAGANIIRSVGAIEQT
jgi:hypothetical protein